MSNRMHLVAEGLRLLVLCFALIIGLQFVSPSQAQASQLKFEQVSSVVISVNGNIVQMAGGFSADLSEAQFQGRFGEPGTRPEIRIGDVAKIAGTVVSAPGQPVMIKAASAHFDTGKEFFYMGIVQKSDAKNNTITILNRDITLTNDAQLFNQKGKPIKLKSFKPNDYIDLDGLGLDSGIIVNSLVKYRFDEGPKAQIMGFVKSINGSIMELEGGFKFDLKPILQSNDGPDFDVFKDLNNFGPGTEIIIGLLDKTALNLPKGAPAVDGAFGFSRGPVTIDANLQAVDPVGRTITVLNRKIAIPEKAYVSGPKGNTTLSELVVGQQITILANRSENNEFIVTIVNQPFIF